VRPGARPDGGVRARAGAAVATRGGGGGSRKRAWGRAALRSQSAPRARVAAPAESQVLQWLETVDGLSAAHRASVGVRLVAEDYDGEELRTAQAKVRLERRFPWFRAAQCRQERPLGRWADGLNCSKMHRAREGVGPAAARLRRRGRRAAAPSGPARGV
jgi:hypothetical protein